MSTYIGVWYVLVAVAQATKLLLTGSVPHVELDLATVGVEHQGVHLHTESRCTRGTTHRHQYWAFISHGLHY